MSNDIAKALTAFGAGYLSTSKQKKEERKENQRWEAQYAITLQNLRINQQQEERAAQEMNLRIEENKRKIEKEKKDAVDKWAQEMVIDKGADPNQAVISAQSLFGVAPSLTAEQLGALRQQTQAAGMAELAARIGMNEASQMRISAASAANQAGAMDRAMLKEDARRKAQELQAYESAGLLPPGSSSALATGLASGTLSPEQMSAVELARNKMMNFQNFESMTKDINLSPEERFQARTPEGAWSITKGMEALGSMGGKFDRKPDLGTALNLLSAGASGADAARGSTDPSTAIGVIETLPSPQDRQAAKDAASRREELIKMGVPYKEAVDASVDERAYAATLQKYGKKESDPADVAASRIKDLEVLRNTVATMPGVVVPPSLSGSGYNWSNATFGPDATQAKQISDAIQRQMDDARSYGLGQPVAQSNPGLLGISTVAELDALPVGSEFVWKGGGVHRKTKDGGMEAVK